MQIAAVEQGPQDGATPPASCRSRARNSPPGCRSAISGVRCEDLGDIVEREADARLVGDGGQMQAALVEPPVAATAAQAFSRLLRVTRSRGSGRRRQDAQHDLAGPARQSEALGEHRGEHRRSGQGEAERLRDHRHRVGGELAGAGADGGRARVLDRLRSASVIVPARTAPTPS